MSSGQLVGNRLEGRTRHVIPICNSCIMARHPFPLYCSSFFGSQGQPTLDFWEGPHVHSRLWDTHLTEILAGIRPSRSLYYGLH